MIEPLTKEKLKKYNFSKIQIERLFDSTDYCCYNINNDDFFYACNKERKIYSGQDGQNKYWANEPKEKFETFDELILYAVKMESIDVANNIKFEAVKSLHNYKFNSYLRNIKLVGWENFKEYQIHLTKRNWIEYYNFYLKERGNFKKDKELEKKSWQPDSFQIKTEQETIEIKPVLKPEAVQNVFEIIKDFFNIKQQADLIEVIATGNIASEKLLFKGNGNRLTDTFKKLIEHDFITGCQKQDLINWIISNFTFIKQGKEQAFVYDTVEKTISRNNYPCKTPLIEIKNGQIQKVELPKARKQNNY